MRRNNYKSKGTGIEAHKNKTSFKKKPGRTNSKRITKFKNKYANFFTVN